MSERSDLSDRASVREKELRDDAIAEVVRQLPRGPDHADCLVCGEPIGEARRRALPGVATCIDCQTEIDAALDNQTYRTWSPR